MKTRFSGVLFILAAVIIRFLFPNANFPPFLAGGFFGGGCVLLFGIARKEEQK